MPKPNRIKSGVGRPKSYLHRLPAAVKALEALPASQIIGREWISQHLGVSKGTALRIIAEAGSRFYANLLVTDVARLVLFFVAEIRSPELRQRIRTAQSLEDMARSVSQRQRVVAGQADASRLKHTLFKSLFETPGVSLTRSRLAIDFAGMEDFLRKFGLIIYALQNDFDEMREFLDAPSRDTPL